MEILKNINLALAFLLELCMLAALGYWGFTPDQGLAIRVGAGVGVPVPPDWSQHACLGVRARSGDIESPVPVLPGTWPGRYRGPGCVNCAQNRGGVELVTACASAVSNSPGTATRVVSLAVSFSMG